MIGPRPPHRMRVWHPTGPPDSWNIRPGVTTDNVPCRIDYGHRLIRTATGQEVTSRALITTEHPVEVGDIVWLPGGPPDDPGNQVLDVRHVDDLGGRPDHREVYL